MRSRDAFMKLTQWPRIPRRDFSAWQSESVTKHFTFFEMCIVWTFMNNFKLFMKFVRHCVIFEKLLNLQINF